MTMNNDFRNDFRNDFKNDFRKNYNKKFDDLSNMKEYNFLFDEPNLRNTILLVPGGSISYGTNVKDMVQPDGTLYSSDFDLRGIAGNTEETLFGSHSFNIYVKDGDIDVSIYNVNHIFKLLCDSNPNVIELLGNKEDNIIYVSEPGQLMIDNRKLFITKQAVKSFGDYANAQFRRLENALARDTYNQVDKTKHIMKTLQASMHNLQDMYGQFPDTTFKLYLEGTEIFTDVHIDHFKLTNFANTIKAMNVTINNYNKLNHRNRKKDEQHLYKHAMHLIRLHMTLYYMLTEGDIYTYLPEEDRKVLLDIRFKKYSFDEIFKMNDEWTKKNHKLAETSKIPDTYDANAVEKLLITINKMTA